MQYYLRRDAVHRTVENPSLDAESEARQGEIRAPFEEDMCDYPIRSPLPFVQAEREQKPETQSQRRRYVGITPRVGTSGPVQGKEEEGSGADEEDGADGVDFPEDLLEGHAWVVGALLGPVEEVDAQACRKVEGCLHPEDAALLRVLVEVCVRDV